MLQARPVTIAELLSSNWPPRPPEAVAIAIELSSLVIARRAADAVASAICPATVSIDASGAVAVTGGVPAEDEQTVSLVGHLLVEMLDPLRGDQDPAVSPRLLATATRAAVRGNDAFASLGHLVAALKRHAPEQRHAAIRSAFDRSRPAAVHTRGVGRARPSAPVRYLHGAKEDIHWARFGPPASGGPAEPEMPGAETARPSRTWMATALAVGLALLLLAGASIFLLSPASSGPVPPLVPPSRPMPVSPRREPGWELLGKPERTSVATAPAPAAPRRAEARVTRRSAGSPAEGNDPSHGAAVPKQQER